MMSKYHMIKRDLGQKRIKKKKIYIFHPNHWAIVKQKIMIMDLLSIM